MMVCGVTVLIGVLEKTGGMDLFTGPSGATGVAGTINGVIAFVTGAISTYSSTSGVVLPAFLPDGPALVRSSAAAIPLAVALSINVGRRSSTSRRSRRIGALCVAAVADPVEARTLFRALLIWGLSMTLVGALFAQIFAPLLAAAAVGPFRPVAPCPGGLYACLPASGRTGARLSARGAVSKGSYLPHGNRGTTPCNCRRYRNTPEVDGVAR